MHRQKGPCSTAWSSSPNLNISSGLLGLILPFLRGNSHWKPALFSHPFTGPSSLIHLHVTSNAAGESQRGGLESSSQQQDRAKLPTTRVCRLPQQKVAPSTPCPHINSSPCLIKMFLPAAPSLLLTSASTNGLFCKSGAHLAELGKLETLIFSCIYRKSSFSLNRSGSFYFKTLPFDC